MKPVLFTVSSDGRSIQGLSNQMESIEIQRVSKNDYELDTINRDTTSIEQVKRILRRPESGTSGKTSGIPDF